MFDRNLSKCWRRYLDGLRWCISLVSLRSACNDEWGKLINQRFSSSINLSAKKEEQRKTPNRDENVNSNAESFTSLLFIHPLLCFSEGIFFHHLIVMRDAEAWSAHAEQWGRSEHVHNTMIIHTCCSCSGFTLILTSTEMLYTQKFFFSSYHKFVCLLI